MPEHDNSVFSQFRSAFEAWKARPCEENFKAYQQARRAWLKQCGSEGGENE